MATRVAMQRIGTAVTAAAARTARRAGSSGPARALGLVRGGAAARARSAPLRPTPGARSFRSLIATSAAAADAPEAETREYQAEVTRLLDLIVNSLYSNKDVFLRELVSNASDALDKIRFVSLTEPALLGTLKDFEIRIKADSDAKALVIRDTGIGMTRDELVNSLGTIASSGTKKFFEQLKEQGKSADANLIGQFGVGFYSAFLVADKVTVRTKSVNDDKQWVWESSVGSSSYTIKEDDGEPLDRGTSIELQLREDMHDYADAEKIAELVKTYSEFISFPIFVWQGKDVAKQVKDEEGTAKAKAEYEKKKEEGTLKEDDKEPEDVMKTEWEKEWDWRTQNDLKPIWTRNPRDVEGDEYNQFFKTTFREFADPAGVSHFSMEGQIEFKSILFVPGMAPFEQVDMTKKSRSIRLYVKRVFISDTFDEDLMPRYLNFVKGVVDCDDLPLNVSREILQESRIVRIIRKRLLSKSLDMLKEIQARDNDDYDNFWKSFGRNLKLGIIEDQENRETLAKLLKFHSTTSGEKTTTLQDYVGRMKEDQEQIYFLAADSVDAGEKSPFVESLIKKDYEVLYLLEPVDEVAITNLASFDSKKFVDVSKEDLDLGSQSEEEKKEIEEKSKEFEDFIKWMKRALGDRVENVVLSTRLTDSPCVVVTSKFGWSANMERIMRAQALGDDSAFEYMKGKKIMEINPEHPVIKSLQQGADVNPDEKALQVQAVLLYDTAAMTSGFSPENPQEFASRVYQMMTLSAEGNLSGAAEAASDDGKPSPPEEQKAEKVQAEVVDDSDPWKK